MLRGFHVLMSGVVFCISACAIHPLPQDTTGLRTSDIVQQIRCETRESGINLALEWLMNPQQDHETRILASEFFAKKRKIETFHYKLFKGNTKKVLQLFYDTGIAYNYSLEMSEVNNVGGGVNLIRPFNGGAGAFGLTIAADRQRQNLRTFTITDAFSKLIIGLSDDECNIRLKGQNFLYPMSGKIGIKAILEDFVDLTLFANLSGPKGNTKAPPTLVDALDFQTILSLSGGPRIVFSPIGASLSVADASIGGSISRRDTHRVIIGLALPDTFVGDAIRFRDTLVTPLLTARGGPSELEAADAVSQVLTRQTLRSVFTITP